MFYELAGVGGIPSVRSNVARPLSGTSLLSLRGALIIYSKGLNGRFINSRLPHIEAPVNPPRPLYPDHHHPQRSRSPSVRHCSKRLAELDESELFMELIRDVANELDIDVLCHKILVNVGLLTHADRGSLFLTKTNQNERFLVAKLFDVTQTTGT